jgi:geranylgeranyl diphosphate synthase type 3
MLNLHRGQGMDIYWRDHGTCPTEDEYLDMIDNSLCSLLCAQFKSETGGLLRLAVKLMQACSAATRDYVPLVNQLGLLYQIRDDYMNLCSDQVRNSYHHHN